MTSRKETIYLLITNIILIFLLGLSIYFIVQTFTHTPKAPATHIVKTGGGENNGTK